MLGGVLPFHSSMYGLRLPSGRKSFFSNVLPWRGRN
jgi:hypothetical protein